MQDCVRSSSSCTLSSSFERCVRRRSIHSLVCSPWLGPFGASRLYHPWFGQFVYPVSQSTAACKPSACPIPAIYSAKTRIVARRTTQPPCVPCSLHSSCSASWRTTLFRCWSLHITRSLPFPDAWHGAQPLLRMCVVAGFPLLCEALRLHDQWARVSFHSFTCFIVSWSLI